MKDVAHEIDSTEAGSPVFHVSASTVPAALAQAMTKTLARRNRLTLQAIGPGAIYRATLALAIARVLLASYQLDLQFVPYFGDTTIDGQTLIGMIFDIEHRSYSAAAPTGHAQS